MIGLLIAPTLGPERVSNGTFASDSQWTKGTGWSISGGKANKVAGGGSLTQTIASDPALKAGATYRITYTISGWTGGLGITAGILATPSNVWGTARSANGTYTEDLVCPASAGSHSITFAPSDGAEVCSIDNVSMRRVY